MRQENCIYKYRVFVILLFLVPLPQIVLAHEELDSNSIHVTESGFEPNILNIEIGTLFLFFLVFNLDFAIN